jgi:outer membrane protein insertion porin family
MWWPSKNNFIRIILLNCILCSSVWSLAQPIVQKISFAGLEKTQPEFLKQYVTSKVGIGYDSARVAADRQRLLNLTIFSEIETILIKTDRGIEITFSCVEMINTLPVFALGKTGDTFWCKAGVQSLNFTGRADKLFAYYQYYDRHSFYLNYATDRIQNTNWGLGGSLIKWATIEPLTLAEERLTYNYTNYTAYINTVRFFSFRETLETGFGYFNERFEPRQIGDVTQEKIIQGDKLLGKVIFRSNHLNYENFYVDGFYNQLNVELIHSVDSISNFITVFNDFRFFKSLRKFNWANRVRVGLATNNPNPFAPFVLDSYLNLRGVGNRVDRGTGSVVINTEVRYTLFDRRMFAAQSVAFLDFGSWRKPGGSFADFKKSENMKAFGGVGFRLIYKQAFDTMLRVDYGYDYDKNKGIVIGIGQYF